MMSACRFWPWRVLLEEEHLLTPNLQESALVRQRLLHFDASAYFDITLHKSDYFDREDPIRKDKRGSGPVFNGADVDASSLLPTTFPSTIRLRRLTNACLVSKYS